MCVKQQNLVKSRYSCEERPCRYPGMKILGLILLLLFAVTGAIAQTGSGGTVQGTISDQTNAVIAGVKVSATNVNTGVVSQTLSTSAGYYVIPALIPGLYTISAEKDGFQIFTQENIQVNALQVVGINIKMVVGSTTESVTVTTAPPPLQTENASMTTTMENETYTALPLNMGGSQRDPTNFASLTPGFAGGGRSGTYNGAGGSSNGSSSSGAVTYLDGLIVSQGDNRQVSLVVSVDAIDQFQVTNSGENASQTGMGSQNYNVKHGTNTFHGSLYDYVRNTAFDSWDFFAKAATVPTADGGTKKAPKPAEHQMELGMTYGGPIQRNKMFLFLSGEVYRYTAYQSPTLMSVPTQLMRNGDFSQLDYQIYDPTTLKVSGSTYSVSPFAGNKIPASRISPAAQNMISFMPQPSNPQLADNYLAIRPTGNSNYEMTERFDWVLTPRQRISILGNVGKRGFIGYDYNSTAVLPVPYMNASTVTQFMDSGILEHTFIATPNLVNEFKFGYVRMDAPVSNPTYGMDKYKATTMGIGNIPVGQASDTFPAVTFKGGQYGYDTWYSPTGYKSTNNSFIVHDDVSWAHGKHLITGGFDFQSVQKNASSWSTISAPLSLTFNQSSTSGFIGKASSGSSLITNSGDPFASFMLGAVNSSSITIQNYSTLGTRTHPFAPYIQDDWKVRPNLTLNLGLRYELFYPLTEVMNRGSFMKPGLINPATGSSGAMMYLGNGTGGCNCSTPAHTYYGNLGPRVGFAWSVAERTVVRGAFGINYSRNAQLNATTGTTGLTKSTSFASTVNGEQPAFYLNSNMGSSAFPTWASTFTHSASENAGNYLDPSSNTYPTAGSVSMADPYHGGRAPTVYNWNFGVQHALTRDLTVTATYAGTKSLFLTSSKSSGVNYLDPKYLVIGKYLGELPTKVDSSTKQTYLADAQGRFSGVGIPFSNFGGSNGTISQMLRAYPQYSSVSNTWGADAIAYYHGLQISVAQRAWHDFSYTANFSWSKTMDNTGNYRAVGPVIPGNVITGGKTVTPGRMERSISLYDQPAVFNFYGTYKLPFGKGKLGSNNAYARQIAGGWAVSWIYSLAAGRPLSVSGSCTTSGQGSCFPSYNPNFHGNVRINGKWGKGYLANMSNAPRYINSDAFMAPAGYMLGNLARTAPYNLRYPHSTDMDLALMRTFDVWKPGNVKFIFRAEVFNLTNHVEFKGIGTGYPCLSGSDFGTGGGTCTLSASQSFGRVSSQANDARDWQFSGKFNF